MTKSKASAKINGSDSIVGTKLKAMSRKSEAAHKGKKQLQKNASPSLDSSDGEEDTVDDRSSDESPSDVSSASTTDTADQESSSDSESDSDSKSSRPVKVNGLKQVSKPLTPGKRAGHVNGTGVQSESDSDSESDSSQSDHILSAGGRTAKKSANSANKRSGNDSDKNFKAASNSQISHNLVDDKSSESSNEASDASSGGDTSSQSIESDHGALDSSNKEAKDERDIITANKRKSEMSESHVAKRAKVDAGTPSKNLFVGNLSWSIDEEWLQREFAEFGEIAGCRIIYDRASGRSKGFGYVEFTNSDSAASALEAKKGALLDGREMNVDFSVPRFDNANPPNRLDRTKERASKFGDTKSHPSDTLFVGNIPFSATAEELQESFGEYGNITRVSIPTDQASGAPKGFGYISFTSVEEAKAAFEALNGINISGRSLRLDFATPRPSGDAGFRGGRGDFRGNRGGDRGGRGMRGSFKSNRGDAQNRGGRGFSTNRGGIGDFSGKKMTF